MAGQQWPEAADRPIPTPPAADGRDDVRAVGQPRPLRAEERIYTEPPGAPEIGRRPLDLDAGQPIFAQTERARAQPMPLHQFMRTTIGLHPRPEHQIVWEHLSNTVWLNWTPSRARTGRGSMTLYIKSKNSQLSTRGTR